MSAQLVMFDDTVLTLVSFLSNSFVPYRSHICVKVVQGRCR
jgi:hypothetical protein